MQWFDWQQIDGQDGRQRAYTRDLTDWTWIDCGPSHNDTAIGANGHDYYLGIDWSNYGDANCSSANGYVFMKDIHAGFVSEGYATGRVDLMATYVGGAHGVHVSGRALDRPGFAVVSTYYCNSGTCPASISDRVYLVPMQVGSTPLLLAQTWNDYGGGLYFAEPQATINRAGTRVLYASNHDDTCPDEGAPCPDENVDSYIIDLPAATFTITTTTMANGTNGQAYQADAQTAGGVQPPTACVTSAGAVPTGATWSVSGNACRLSDASIETGTYNFTLQATDSDSNVDTQAFTLTVTATLTIDTTTLPDGTQGSGYSQALSISGGTPPYTCTVQSGSLPAGASLGGTGNCTITASNLTGTGESSFTIRATDDVAATDDQAFTLTVNALATLSMMSPIIQPLATSVVVTTGAVGLDYASDCQGILKDNGGATVDTQTSTSGSARRRLTFTGLTAASTYSLTLTCEGAQPDVTPYPFVTKPAPSGGDRTVPIQLGAPGITLTGVARCSVEYDDNEALSTPATAQNTDCASGGTINLTIPAGLYWYRTLWQTAADATLATSAIQPLLVE